MLSLPCIAVMAGALAVTAEDGFDKPVSPQVRVIEEPEAAEAKIITNSIGMKLTLIPAGEFMMGSPNSDSDADSQEKPHRVRITKPFYLGTTEVTQGQYKEVSGENPSHFRKLGPTLPVELVSWEDAQAFCRKLSELTQQRYRLPTEAEWEYACRAGSAQEYCSGDDESGFGDYAWYTENSGGMTHWGGQKKPNAWGLYDMHGNVWEWCADWYDSGYYAKSPLDAPAGPPEGTYRVFRGGSWYSPAKFCRSADRGRNFPLMRFVYLGFRVALVPADASAK
jgi:formylglycine-generating enzyme required for sulfatase activity